MYLKYAKMSGGKGDFRRTVVPSGTGKTPTSTACLSSTTLSRRKYFIEKEGKSDQKQPCSAVSPIINKV